MSLFTDGNIATIDDLKEYESAILQTASIEQVDLTAKLKLAHRDIGFEIESYLVRHGFPASSVLGRVYVNDALLHWHCVHTLELIYHDAYNSQLNDRYLGKWKEYAKASSRAAAATISLGIGLVGTPVPRALAPVLSTQAGGGLGTRAYYITIAWQAASGSAGEQSYPVVVNAPLSTLVHVNAGEAPANATGWYVYAGESETDLHRQNVLPLSPGTSWLEPATGLRSDLPGVRTQTPDWFVRNDRLLLRG